jgi:hypothetical protein
MEKDSRGLSMKEEEYQRKAREELSNEKMKTMRMNAKMIELEDNLSKYKSMLNESKRNIESYEKEKRTNKENYNKRMLASTANIDGNAMSQQEHLQRMHVLNLEKSRLEEKIETLEHLLHESKENEKRLKHENLLLSTETKLMQKDLYAAQNNQIVAEEAAIKQRKIVAQYKIRMEKYESLDIQLMETRELLRDAEEQLRKETRSRLIEREKTNGTINHLMDEKDEYKNVLLKEQSNEEYERKQMELRHKEWNEERKRKNEELAKLKSELNQIKQMKLASDEQSLRMKRELDLRSSELNLESSMRNELDDIRNDFKSFLNQSKNVISPGYHSSTRSSGSGSPLIGEYSFGRTTEEMLNSSSGVGSDDVREGGGNSSSRDRLSEELQQRQKREEQEILQNNYSDDDGSTSIRISRRGSIRVHAPPTKQ